MNDDRLMWFGGGVLLGLLLGAGIVGGFGMVKLQQARAEAEESRAVADMNAARAAEAEAMSRMEAAKAREAEQQAQEQLRKSQKALEDFRKREGKPDGQ